ncbi:MAG TPA: GNAT family N-acetyltransferase [Pseudomonadales bacterium]|nr:GNAT family N-acetyltransferase [Pseudomonadales bacterium]
MNDRIGLRDGTRADLERVNAIVEAAARSWGLAERVLRLALPSYRYADADLDHMTLRLAERDGALVALSALEEADPRDTPANAPALLLHGIYVDPDAHGRGIGTLLVNDALDAVRAAGRAGLLVKAQQQANGFFEALEFEAVPVTDPLRDYPHRWWRPITLP